MKQDSDDMSPQNAASGSTTLFNEDEFEVAEILLRLPQLIFKSESRLRFFSSTWGSKKRRSAINLTPPPSPPTTTLPPPNTTTTSLPPPTTSLPSFVIVKAEAASPATPLLFSPSESDDKSKRSSRKLAKKRKREELLEMISELTQRRELLQGEVETVRLYYTKLKSLNLELKAKKHELSPSRVKPEAYKEIMKKPINLAMDFFQKPEHYHHQHEQQVLQPLIVHQTDVSHHSGLASQWASSNGVDKVNHMVLVTARGLPDLNVSLEDVCGVEQYQPFDVKSSDHLINTDDLNRAMAAAEARKKRRQIYKEKNSIVANKHRNGHR